MPESNESKIRLRVGDRECEIDLDQLTLGEIEEIEVYFDRPLGDIAWNSARGTIFLAYLARKRVEPTWTLDDVRSLMVDDIEEVEGAKRPTAPRRRTAGSRSSAKSSGSAPGR